MYTVVYGTKVWQNPSTDTGDIAETVTDAWTEAWTEACKTYSLRL